MDGKPNSDERTEQQHWPREDVAIHHSSKKRLDLHRLELLAPETGLFSELERRSSFRNPR